MNKGVFFAIFTVLLIIILLLCAYLFGLWNPSLSAVFSSKETSFDPPGEDSYFFESFHSTPEFDETDISSPKSSDSDSLPLPPQEPLIPVFKRADRSEALTFHDFYQAGLSCRIVHELNSQYAYGQVISVEFSGMEDADHYYVNKNTPVTLYVSSAAGENADAYADKIIYLTFDDGPSCYTSELLDVLESYHVQATFFPIGSNADTYPEQIRTLFEKGHVLGCHSYTHRYADCYASADALEAEIRRWESSVSSILGQTLPYRLFRYPGGSSTGLLPAENYTPIRDRLANMGYYSFDWTCANCDKWLTPKRKDQTDRQYFESQVISTVSGIEDYHPERPRIMLLHETVAETRNMMPWIIEYLSAKGYVFRTLDRLNESYYF